MKRILFLILLLAAVAAPVIAQEIPTEVRIGQLQLGGGYAFAHPDYADATFKGPYVYTTFDFREHWGIEGNFKIVYEPTSTPQRMYEKTYEVGPRYVWHKKALDPYIKGLVGRGVFNFPNDSANLGYNLFSVGGGLDVRVRPYLNVRVVDAEFQDWYNFEPHSLEPFVLSFGVAYRFH